MLGLILLFAVVVGAASHQQQVQLPDGVTAQVNWTTSGGGGDGEGAIAFTVSVDTIQYGWLGFGASTNNGLGNNPLAGSGAVVGVKIQGAWVVREFALSQPQLAAEVYSSGGLAMKDATDCVATFCQSESQSCYSQGLCRNALLCASDKFAALSPENVTDQSFDSLYSVFQPCVDTVSNPNVPEQNKALGLLLAAGSCFASSCSSKMLDISTRAVNVNASALVQTAGASRLTLALNRRQLAGARFGGVGAHTFYVALGAPFPSGPAVSDQTKLSAPASWATFTVDLDSGSTQKAGVPAWLVWHVLLTVLGLPGVFGLSLCARRVRTGRSWVAFAMGGCGLLLGTAGCLVVSVGAAQRSDPTDVHKVLSLLAVVLAALVWVGGVYHDPVARSRPWEAVAASKVLLDAGPALGAWALSLAELASLGALAAACVTGYATVAASSLDPGQLVAAAVAGCALCALSALLAGLLPLASAARRRPPAKVAELEVANPVFAEGAAADVEAPSGVAPLTLAWSRLSFAAPARNGGAAKPIFTNAVGVCAPRTLTCVLGPSGAGKSSLLDFLGCRNAHPAAPGSQLTVNGLEMARFPGIHRHIATVPQSDVLHERLTVLETLQFACEMVLPSATAAQDKVDHMLRVVAQLGMGHVLDTLVGGGAVRGLSGGERRRVSIALQLIKSPSILLLDEPTSGLDAHMALKLCKVLRELANEGRAVLATVHQPSVACFELFDRVVVLSAGHTVYSGTRTGVAQFLQGCGRGVPASGWNPADWILTLVDFNREEGAGAGGALEFRNDAQTEEILRRRNVRSQGKGFKAATFDERMLGADVALLREGVVAYYQQVNADKASQDPGLMDEVVGYTLTRGVDAVEAKLRTRYGVSFLPFLAAALAPAARSVEPCTREELEKMVARFHASKDHQDLLGVGEARPPVAAAAQAGGAYAQTFAVQMQLLANRSALLVWRNPQAFRFQAAQNLVFGLLIGALYSNIRSLNSAYQIAFSMASILAMVAFVAVSVGIQIAFNNKLVFEREISDAMYSPYAHFMQSAMVGVPVAVAIALCLIVPAYFLIGLKQDGDSFFFFFLVNVAVVFFFDSVAFALALFTDDINTAHVAGNFVEAMTIFFSGVFVPVYIMPAFMGWIYFISPFSYAFGAVVVNEFTGTDNDFVIRMTGVVVRDQWINLIIVFIMGFIWRLLGLGGIIRLFNQKRPGKGFKV
ncbi:hypothetical protein BASA81_003395 [Batrachochytrium salamandrivorans]|nr:hypothetical protein BASA81_003395 [Batrachochytrium salamandrivorans]